MAVNEELKFLGKNFGGAGGGGGGSGWSEWRIEFFVKI